MKQPHTAHKMKPSHLSRILALTCLLVVTMVPSLLHSQTGKPMRIEFPVEGEDAEIQLLPAGDKGLLLFYQVQSANQRENSLWEAAFLDRNLKPLWSKQITVNADYEYQFMAGSSDTAVVGFQGKSRKGGLTRMLYEVISMKEGQIGEMADEVPEKLQVVKGRYLNGYLLVGLSDRNDHLLVRVRKIPGDFVMMVQQEEDSRNVLQDIRPLEGYQGFRLIFENFTSRKESVVVVADYSFSGQLLKAVRLDLASEQNVLNGVRMEDLGDGKQLILGAYANQKSKKVEESQNRAEESTGFFGGLLSKGSFQTQNFYNFLDFKNFFNRMRGNQAIYDGRKADKDKEVSSDYRLLLHDILRFDNDYVLVAEAYYPEYHTVTTWSYDYYGHMVPNYYTVFDGYRYNNAFICGFDSSGNLRWENSIEITNILSMKLKERVCVNRDNNDVILGFLSEGKIAAKVVSRDQTLDGIEYYPIENADKHDRVISNDGENLLHWYDEYFLAYGIQEIKNLTRTDSRRIVFYINKIAFR